MRILSLLHATVISADLEKSRAFYGDVLGLPVNPTRPNLPYDGIWYDVGPNQMIHLMLLPNPDAGVTRPEHGGRDRHTALAIDDLDALMQRLDAAGIHYSLSKSGRRALFCRDPDENALEFLEQA
ncbi:diguanylate cyclase [Novimethylophilus kurashikiensis]|uniref:Diguanylate cyclase n=1 Tax=Novimethylophilus kurashikiensis TaxID=1825523 RepID=A0A2R5F9S4_9PROT|nr:VOC family protein [Novimethylophilus kurashikiensis]GBG14947.1 diguanylate cyclase [Novimethylophilus kurashikiensis]